MAGKGLYEGLRVRMLVLVLVAAVVVLGGSGVAGACRLTSLDCTPEPRSEPLKQESGAVSVPVGFSVETVASGLEVPTAFDFLPDGRIVVAQKDGLVKLVVNGNVAPTPVLDLRKRVNTYSFRGLVAVAADPDFDENQFIYVVYSARRNGTTSASLDPTYVVVSRFVLSGARAGQERVILGAQGRTIGACADLPATADCLPMYGDHIGADIAFARDRTVFISTGDGGGGHKEAEETAYSAQNVDALSGKILRVTRDGLGLTSNPFFEGDTTANRSKVWAFGLRNPFRLSLTSSGLPVVGDVGRTRADEVDVVPAAANLGWPCFEGVERTEVYRSTSRCEALYGGRVKITGPTILLPLIGPREQAASVTGGVFVTGDAYPEKYRSYFYADWVRSWIRYAPIDQASGKLLGEPSEFAEDAGGPVALRQGPDGDLYVLALNYGALYRITYED